MSIPPTPTFTGASLGTLADARWSLAVRWWLPEDHPLQGAILHKAEPWASRLAPRSTVLAEALMARLGIPLSVSNIGPLLYAMLTVEERALLTLAGVKWALFDTELSQVRAPWRMPD
jgi:hypothetical protein